MTAGTAALRARPASLSLPACQRRRVVAPDGVAVAVQEWGPRGAGAARREILLIHGYSQAHGCWLHQVAAPLAQEFRLVSYDLRGHGDSDKPLTADFYLDAERWAGEVAAVIAGTGLQRPVVVAWSYAGRIILDYLAAHGEQALGGLVMAGASASTDPALLGPGAVLLSSMVDADPQRAHAATVAMLRAGSARPLSSEELDYMLEYNERVPWQIRGWLRGRSADYERVLRSLRLPTLVIHGDRDPINLPAMAAYTASRIAGARSLLYPDVAHMPFWEAPARFNADLAAFARAPG